MDQLLAIGIFGLFVCSVLAILYFLPPMLIKWRASALGLTLTFGQARKVAKYRCNHRQFLQSVREIWFWEEIPIEKLAIHYLSRPDKDLTNLRDGIIEMKQMNKEIDFAALATFDLAGRDLKEAVREGKGKLDYRAL